MPYVISILSLNSAVLLLAIYQAFKARNIATDFSESKYIGIVVLSMLQIFILAIPIIYLTVDKPQVTYLLCIALGFSSCVAILSFIFIPKILATHNLKWKDTAPLDSFGRFMSNNQNRSKQYAMYGIDLSSRSLRPTQIIINIMKHHNNKKSK